jgi:hypothetical protein
MYMYFYLSTGQIYFKDPKSLDTIKEVQSSALYKIFKKLFFIYKEIPATPKDLNEVLIHVNNLCFMIRSIVLNG